MSTQSSSDFDLQEAPNVADTEEAGQVIHLLDRNDDPAHYVDGEEGEKPITMRVAGTYSHTYRKAEQRQRRQMIKRRGNPTPDDLENQQLQIEAACVLGWEGITAGGAPVPHNIENATKVLRAMPWVRRQVQRAMEDHAGFFRSASGS